MLMHFLQNVVKLIILRVKGLETVTSLFILYFLPPVSGAEI